MTAMSKEVAGISREKLENALELLNEHASTLEALATTLRSSDPRAADSARGVAHQLLELEKDLADERERPH